MKKMGDNAKLMGGSSGGRVARRLGRTGLAVALAVGWAALVAGCGDSADLGTGGSTNVVRQIGHVLVASGDADGLFGLLTGTFELPVAWPMKEHGGFASGGVALGNVHLEIVRASARSTEAGGRLRGFSLEPEPMGGSLAALKERGIPHGKPAPFHARQPGGGRVTLWTTVALPEVSGEELEVFLCEYGHDVVGRRRQLTEELRSRGGGPLTVVSVEEVVVGARDVARARELWGRLLAPAPSPTPGVWPMGAGPAIRIVESGRDEVQGLVVLVGSLEKARQFLLQKGLAFNEGPEGLRLGGAPFEGWEVTLREDQAGGR